MKIPLSALFICLTAQVLIAQASRLYREDAKAWKETKENNARLPSDMGRHVVTLDSALKNMTQGDLSLEDFEKQKRDIKTVRRILNDIGDLTREARTTLDEEGKAYKALGEKYNANPNMSEQAYRQAAGEFSKGKTICTQKQDIVFKKQKKALRKMAWYVWRNKKTKIPLVFTLIEKIFEQSLNEQTTQMERLQSEKGVLEKEKEDLVRRLDSLKSELSTSRKEIEEKEKYIKEKEIEIAEKEEEIKGLKKELENLSTEKEQLTTDTKKLLDEKHGSALNLVIA
jgi:chromosome segregation ATPase